MTLHHNSDFEVRAELRAETTQLKRREKGTPLTQGLHYLYYILLRMLKFTS